MKTLTIEIKFYEPDALGEALQDIIDQLGQGANGGETTIKQELPYVYTWSIKKWYLQPTRLARQSMLM